MVRIFLACFLFCLTFPVHAFSADTWAVYWYICGSDLESEHGSASADIAELLRARLPDNVTVVLQTGGTKKWQNGISSKKISRFVYRGKDLELVDTQPQASMGSGKTLASFLSFCKKNYPADHQVFVFWDHGGGSARGLCNDENFDYEPLSLKDVNEAFSKVYTSSEEKPPFEIIGFDTCLMASLDTANAVHGFARYMVASQEQEPGNGWEYTKWVGALGRNTSMNGAELGKIICDAYMAGCVEEDTQDTATLSLIDLSKLTKLNRGFNALGIEAVTRAVDNESFYATFGRGAKSAENYVNNRSEGFSCMVDIGSLVRNLKNDLPEFSQYTLDALGEAVLYQVSGRYRKPSGLSCYYPYDGDDSTFRAMVDPGNITSFLILNGLQHGFIDGDEAAEVLETISNELTKALEKEEAEENGEGTSSTQQSAETKPEQPSPQQNAETKPEQPSTGGGFPSFNFGAVVHGGDSGSGSSGGGEPSAPAATPDAVVGLFQHASSQVLGSVKPLEKLDISSLEDFNVSVTKEGDALLDLGPERVRFIDSVRFYLAYYSVEDDVIMLLGKDADMKADWEKGTFRDNFRGVWAALDGHLVYMEITGEYDDYNLYVVPVMLNGVRCNLQVVYDFGKEKYQVLGARRVIENNVVDKVLIKLKPGDKVTTILKGMTISGDDDDFQEVEVDTFTLGKKYEFKDIDMGDGTFMFMFEMTDVQNNTATSKVVTIEVEGDNIRFSDD